MPDEKTSTPAEREKIVVSWDDLQSDKVDERIKQQESIAQARQAYESAPAPEALHRHKRTSLFYNSLVYMTLFGLLGGALGWGVGEIMHLRPNLRAQARDLLEQRAKAVADTNLKGAEAQGVLDELDHAGRNNPYYRVAIDDKLPEAEKQLQIDNLTSQDRWREFVANVLFYGACGLFISLCLAIAEPLVNRNIQGAVINGAVGATVGLMGGVVVALFVDRIYQLVIGADLGATANKAVGSAATRKVIAHAVQWGILGVFLSLAPGVVLRNSRRLLVGVLGGLVGGVLGGVLFEPVLQATQNVHLARLAAILAIGLIAGLGTGLIENVAKAGWLRVTTGLIAGKQFVLYRNPTYLGSSPHCQVYLFKDPQVGRRHAAVHIVPGGFEVENLPLGGPTLVNGQPVSRARLRHGDKIQAGSTTFLFHERAKKTEG